MARLVDTGSAFHFDCGLPLPLLVFEAAAGDAINIVRFELRRLPSAEVFLAVASLFSSFNKITA